MGHLGSVQGRRFISRQLCSRGEVGEGVASWVGLCFLTPINLMGLPTRSPLGEQVVHDSHSQDRASTLFLSVPSVFTLQDL